MRLALPHEGARDKLARPNSVLLWAHAELRLCALLALSFLAPTQRAAQLAYWLLRCWLLYRRLLFTGSFMLAPPQSLHSLLRQLCWQMLAPRSPCTCSYGGRAGRRLHVRSPCIVVLACTCLRLTITALARPQNSEGRDSGRDGARGGRGGRGGSKSLAGLVTAASISAAPR